MVFGNRVARKVFGFKGGVSGEKLKQICITTGCMIGTVRHILFG
jgi:hypothetical protein